MFPSSYIIDIAAQTLTIHGKTYDKTTINQIKPEQRKNYDSDIWDELVDFLKEWFNDKKFIEVHTSGSTGYPQVIQAGKKEMINSACMTCNFLKLQKGDSALLCMSLKYIGAKMMVVRSLTAGLNLTVREASGNPLANLETVPVFAAMVPLQVYNSLQQPEEKKLLSEINHLIIGGGAINSSLEKEIQHLPNAVYSTYGMTETLSHIAMRRLNGKEASPYYTPFLSIHISLSTEGTLQINAPLLTPEPVYTNDIAEILPDGRFLIIGRKDNIINTGGIKVQIETAEELLHPYIPFPFAITSIPDPKFGECIVLLIETTEKEISTFTFPAKLPTYYHPKKILPVTQIPTAGNGKKNRKACKELAIKQSGT